MQSLIKVVVLLTLLTSVPMALANLLLLTALFLMVVPSDNHDVLMENVRPILQIVAGPHLIQVLLNVVMGPGPNRLTVPD